MSIDLVKQYLKEYAEYVNETRATISLDGFKAVQRRIYYVTYKLAKDKFIKTATVAGNVVAYYHPHGTASVEDAIVGMVRNGWIIGQGNWGSKTGLDEIKPAASRYTEVRFNMDDLDWSMEYIQYATYTKSEIDYDEPVLIPTPIPIGIIGDLVNFPQPQQGIGVGIKSFIPMYRLQDLVRILPHIIANDQLSDSDIPDPYLGKFYETVKSDKKAIFETGSGKVVIKPKYKYDGKTLHLFACPKDLLRILNPWKDKLTIKDLSKPDFTHIIIEPKKFARINMDEIQKTLLKRLETVVTFITYVAMSNKTYRLSIRNLLKLQFLYYVECRKKYIQAKLNVLTNTLTEAHIIKDLRPYLVKYLQTTDKPNPKEFIANLPKTFDKSIVETLLKKYSIHKLLALDYDIDSLKSEIKEWQKKLSNIIQDTFSELTLKTEKICK